MGRILRRPIPELREVPKNRTRNLRFATKRSLKPWLWRAARSAGSKVSAISERVRIRKKSLFLEELVGGTIERETKQQDIPDPEVQDLLFLDLLRQQGRCCLRVSGTSMLPTLWPGDFVRVKSPSSPSVGEIVLCRRGGRFFLHRLVAVADQPGGEFVARGDSMPQADAPGAVDEIVGVLDGVGRGANWVGVPRRPPMWSKLAGSLLARSSGLVRVAIRVRSVLRGRDQDPRPVAQNATRTGRPPRKNIPGDSAIGVDLAEAPGS